MRWVGASAGDRRAKLQRMYDVAWPLRSRVHAFGARDVVEAYGDFIVEVRAALAANPVADTENVDEARKALRMAIRVSNGVDFADHVETPTYYRSPPFPETSPPAIPQPIPQPMPQPWAPPPGMPGYPAHASDAPPRSRPFGRRRGRNIPEPPTSA